MDRRELGLLALVLTCGIAATVACSAPDPGELTFGEARRGGTEPIGGGSSSGGADGGGADGDDAGDGGAADPIFGTTPFAYVPPGKTANVEGGTAHGGNVEGDNCFGSGCHGAADAGPRWLIGGTVYNAATGGQTVAQAEVRVVDSTGKEVAKAYTDQNGNFWMQRGAADLPANSKVGVRTATKVMRMATTLGGASGGACNNATGCHGPTMRVYVN